MDGGHMQLNERVTRMETKMETQGEVIEDIGITLRTLSSSVTNIEKRLIRQNGFIAGLTLAFTMIGGAIFTGVKLAAAKFMGA